MKKPHIGWHIAIFCLAVLGISLLVMRAHAQSMGTGGQPATKFALQISDCPTVTTGYMICPVVPLNGQPFLAMSVAGYNAGAPFQLASQGVQGPKGDKGDSITGPIGATGATGPIGPAGPVQSFGSNSCKTVNGSSTGWVESGCTQTP